MFIKIPSNLGLWEGIKRQGIDKACNNGEN